MIHDIFRGNPPAPGFPSRYSQPCRSWAGMDSLNNADPQWGGCVFEKPSTKCEVRSREKYAKGVGVTEVVGGQYREMAYAGREVNDHFHVY